MCGFRMLKLTYSVMHVTKTSCATLNGGEPMMRSHSGLRVQPSQDCPHPHRSCCHEARSQTSQKLRSQEAKKPQEAPRSPKQPQAAPRSPKKPQEAKKLHSQKAKKAKNREARWRSKMPNCTLNEKCPNPELCVMPTFPYQIGDKNNNKSPG